MVKLRQLDKNILEREEAKEVVKVQAAIVASLSDFERHQVTESGKDVEISSDTKLQLPLLRRSPETRALSTNFDPALVRVLKEVQYLLLLDLHVPDSALDICQSAEKFRRWTGNLDMIIQMNNSVLERLLPVEKPLVAPYLAKFDKVIERGIHNLNWCSDGVDDFLKEAMDQVQLVHHILKTMKLAAKFQSPMDIGWLRIDITPAKQNVSLYATKWIEMFTSHMLHNVTATLSCQHNFMNSVQCGLECEIVEIKAKNDDLMAVMAVIRDVRKKMTYFAELSGPQNDCVQILRKHGVDVLSSTVAGLNLQDFLEEFPMSWEAVVKKTFKKKEDILPMQMDTVDSLKVDLDEFYLSIRAFRGDFRIGIPSNGTTGNLWNGKVYGVF